MASGYTNSHPRDEGSFYFETRFSWSSSYDPATNTSTVTFYPQIYTTVNMGNDLRMFNSKDNSGGVYRDGSLIYAFPTNYSSGNYLRTWSNPYEDWCGLYTAGDDFPTLTVTHNNSGAASIKLGLRGGVITMYDYSRAYSSWIDDGYYINLSESRSLHVTYYSNGGSGAPDDTYFYGSTESVVLSSTKPTRTGYTFLGWSTSSSATSATYSAGQNIGTRSSNLVLYAVWRINSYTVTCEDRVGSSSGTKLGTKTASYTYGSSVSGASFGSSTTYNAYYTGYHYTGSSSAITVDGNETVYRYFALNTWTVSYNANGGSGAPSSQTKTYGVDLTLSSTKPTRSNSSAGSYTVTYRANYSGGTDPSAATAARTTSYNFSTWNTNQNGSGTSYSSGGKYAANSAVTLYAQWNSSVSTASITLPTMTRTGYTFKGWSTSSSATSGITGSYTPTANVTLYAIWKVNTYTLTINQGTGSTIQVKRGTSTLSNGATISYGDILTISYSANTGYNPSGLTVNGSAFTSGNTHTVKSNVAVNSSATVKQFSLTKSAGTGTTITVTRTYSPLGKAALGELNNGDTLYYSDTLSIVVATTAGYILQTATMNGSAVQSPYSVTSDITIVSTAIAAGGYIRGSSSFDMYQILIKGQQLWDLYRPVTYNGTSWENY